MSVVLSDEQLERIEDALMAAFTFLPEGDTDADRVNGEIADALGIVKAARALLAA